MTRQRKRTPHVDERKKVIAVSAPAKANGAIREDIKTLTEDITAHFTGRKQVSAAIADLDGRLDQIQKSLDDFKAESSRDYDDRLDQIQKSLDVLKKAESSKVAESSKGGFWRRLLQIPDDDPDRARERTRARIAYALLSTLVVAIAATFLYVTLSANQLSPEEIINVTHGLGTTLLAPLVGLIGAVIGFYYGGQTAVQGAQQATAASQKHAETTQATTEAATHATQAAQETSQVATQAAKEATQAATQAAKEATQTATQATQVAKEVAQANHQ